MSGRFQLTATKVRVMAALLLAFGVLSLVIVIWLYAKLLSHIEVTWQILGDPIEKASFLACPFVALGLVVGSAGLLFLKSWARPVLLTAIGLEFLNGLNDFVREPNIVTPLFYAVLVGVFVLVARSKPYLHDRGLRHETQ